MAKSKSTLGQEITPSDVKPGEETTISDNPNTIVAALDMALAANRRIRASHSRGGGAGTYVNVLFEGPAGVGKTGIIESWCHSNNIHPLDLKGSTLDNTDVKGVLVPKKDGTGSVILPTELFDAFTVMKDPNGDPNDLSSYREGVLFLDEYNRGLPEVRSVLLDIIQSHYTYSNDPNLGRGKLLPGLMFVIAAQNPNGGGYQVYPLDPAEEDRFATFEVEADPIATLKFLKESSLVSGGADDDGRNADRLEIAEALLTNPDFHFDGLNGKRGSNKKGLSPRTLESLLLACNGDVDGSNLSFLKLFDNFCNKENHQMVEALLKPVKERRDKANKVLNTGSPFTGKKEVSNYDWLMDIGGGK